MDMADAERKGREVPHAVDEAEGQDEAGVVAVEPGERAVDALAPQRLPRQKPDAEMPADPEIGLVAGETAERRGNQHEGPGEQPLGRSEAREDDESLTLEEGPGERYQVRQRAVFENEPMKVHYYESLLRRALELCNGSEPLASADWVTSRQT